MIQHNPKDSLRADMEALAEVFEAEDREDADKRPSAVVTAFPSPSGNPDVPRVRGRWSDSPRGW